MTSNVRISSNNFPVKIETYDGTTLVNVEIVLVGDTHSDRYITTTRSVRFIDLEENDPQVRAEKKRRAEALLKSAE